MQHFTEDTLNLAAASAQIGNDDADSEIRGCSLRLVFQNPAGPFGGDAHFTTGIDQAQAHCLAGGLGDFALADFRPAQGQGVEQPLLGGRRLKKACKFHLVGEREVSPFDEACHKRRKFGIREPPVLAAAATKLLGPRQEGLGILVISPLRGVQGKMPGAEKIPGVEGRLRGPGDLQQQVLTA